MNHYKIEFFFADGLMTIRFELSAASSMEAEEKGFDKLMKMGITTIPKRITIEGGLK